MDLITTNHIIPELIMFRCVIEQFIVKNIFPVTIGILDMSGVGMKP